MFFFRTGCGRRTCRRRCWTCFRRWSCRRCGTILHLRPGRGRWTIFNLRPWSGRGTGLRCGTSHWGRTILHLRTGLRCGSSHRRRPVLHLGPCCRRGTLNLRWPGLRSRPVLRERCTRLRLRSRRFGANLGHGPVLRHVGPSCNSRRLAIRLRALAYLRPSRCSGRRSIRRGQRTLRRKGRGTSAVGSGELRPVGLRFAGMLNLCGHRGAEALPPRRHFGSGRTSLDAAASTVITDPCARRGNVVVIHIVHVRHVHIGNRAVVIDGAVFPVATVVAVAGVAESVIDSTVEADIRAPVPGMKDVVISRVRPVRRRPERSLVRGQHPRSWDPIVTSLRVGPVAGIPDVVLAGTWRLTVFRERRRRFRRLRGLLATIGSRVIWGVRALIARRLRSGLRGRLINRLGSWLSLRLIGNRGQVSTGGIARRALRHLRVLSFITARKAQNPHHQESQY